MTPKEFQISNFKIQIVLALLSVCLFGRAAVFEHPAGTDSNTVYQIAFDAANSVGGPTNGVTAATAASIAATNAAWSITNGSIGSVVKYLSLNKPVNSDSNWFGPWTPGTTTAGIQEAVNSITQNTNAGPFAKSASIEVGDGYYFYTNLIVISNYYPMGITIKGQSLLSTKLVYAGNSAGTNCITFRGPETPRPSSLNLPNHVTITDIGFSALNNTTNVLLKIGNFSQASLERLNFTSWQVMTNQVEGAGVSTDSSSVNGVTSGNLVGLWITDGPEHSTVLRDIFFAGLATGGRFGCDHVTASGLKFAHIGQFTNSWPATSPYSLGACILREGGLHSTWFDLHFYSAQAGFVYLDEGVDSPKLYSPNFESCQNKLGNLAANTRAPVVFNPIVYGNNTWDDVSLRIFNVSNSPNYGFVASYHLAGIIVGTDDYEVVTGASAFKVRQGAVDLLKMTTLGAQSQSYTWSDSAGTPLFSMDVSGGTIWQFNDLINSLPGILQYDSSTAAFSFSDLVVNAIHSGTSLGGPKITSGSGAPTADDPKGSLYLRTDGSTSNSLYVKTATGSGGWTAK